jgi:TolB-like protein
MLTGAALLGLLSACSTLDQGKSPALERNASWAVLPFENHTETPMAGSRAESIATALLSSRGIGAVKRYTGEAQQETLFDGRDAKRREDALAWARSEGCVTPCWGG